MASESDLTRLTVAELTAGFRDGVITPSDVLDATFARIEEVNGAINAIAHLDEDGARRAASESARRWESGAPLSAIDGVPVTIKDSVNAVGTPWRHGSLGHAGVPDATVDAPPARALKEAGAVIFAKTTMPDFGMLGAGVSSLYGIVRNPWDLSKNPGGSSAGAGAGLAARIGWLAVGTDIAGSVRLPAAHCGVVALKPTQGRIPHLVPSTMRSAGPMARTVDECIAMYRVLITPDERDVWSLPPEPADELDQELTPRGLKVGLMLDMGYDQDLDPAVEAVVRAASDALAAGGAEVAEMPPPFADDPYPALDRVFQVRARTELAGMSEERQAQVLPQVRDWALSGADISSSDYFRDLDAIVASAGRLAAATAAYDVVLSPVIPVNGFGAEEVGVHADQPLRHCRYTEWFNQSAQPATSQPFAWVDGLPVGVQLAGPRFADQKLLRLSRWLEAQRQDVPDWPEPVAGSANEGGN